MVCTTNITNNLLGQSGEKFYIILSGTVSIQVPIKRKKVPQAEQPEEPILPIQTSDLGRNHFTTPLVESTQPNISSKFQSLQKPDISVQAQSSQNISTSSKLQQQKVDDSGSTLPLNQSKDEHQTSQARSNQPTPRDSSRVGSQKGMNNNDVEQPSQHHKHMTSPSKRLQSDNVAKMIPQQSGDLAHQESIDKINQQQQFRTKHTQIEKMGRQITQKDKTADNQEPEEETVYMEVVQLSAGKSFGELALITNKPRAARIKCLTECHFAIMTKHEYSRCLAKIENKTRIRTIQFLSDLPFFASLSKTQLGKLLSAFTVIKYKRGNVLFREGTPNEDIYIVKSGEFAGIRTMIIKSKNQMEPVMQFLRGERTNKSLRTSLNPQIGALTKVHAITNTQSSKEQMQLFLFGKGQIFGEERFLRNEPIAPYTAMCSSLEGEVMRISSIEFMRKILIIPESVEVIKQNTSYKEGKIAQKQFAGLVNHFQMNRQTENSQQQTELQNQDFSKFLLQQSKEPRESLKQIVEGYPVIKRVQKLIKEEDQESIVIKLNNSTIVTDQDASTVRNSVIKSHQRVLSENFTMRNSVVQQSPEGGLSGSFQISQIQSPFKRYKRQKNDKPKGSKLYMSSQLVDAIIEMKRHTQELTCKRSDAKDNLQDVQKKQVIDDMGPQQQTYETCSGSEPEIESDNSQVQLYKTDATKIQERSSSYGDYNIKLNSHQLSKFGNAASTTGHNTPGGIYRALNQSNEDEDDCNASQYQPFSKSGSKKSLKSLVVNSKNKRQQINISQNDIVQLPNKSFYNGDGTQIKMLGTNHMEFSPLIQYLVHQRNTTRPSFANLSRSVVRNDISRTGKVMDKTVFMHVAETLKRGNILNLKNKRASQDFKRQILPPLTRYQ